jgi:KDO2-lipid IV(A) lauroyltransferase
MRRRSAIRNYVEYAAAGAVIGSLRWTPRPFAWALGSFYVRLLDRAIPRLRNVALRNLSLALPEMTAAEHTRIVDEVFASIARLLVVFARLPDIRRSNLPRWIRFEGYEHFEAAKRAGRGVLFATAHLGNWELSAFAHALAAEPMSVVVRPLDNPLIDRMVEARRTLSGNRLIQKKDYARSILKALAANQAVGVLVDQNASPETGAFVDFFGLSACAGTGFARIAARSGATVIPGYALWSESERRHILRFEPPVPITGDEFLDTQAIQSRLEAVIRAYPGQWLWIHRRWKTRPNGEPSLYESLHGAPDTV